MKRSGGPRKLEAAELLTYGMRLLAARALSAGDLRARLQRRAADQANIEPVMEQLRQYGFVDDSKFAEHFASARRDSGSAGQQRVLRDLRQRRISSSIASEAVSSAFEGADEVQMVRDWLERKFRNKSLSEYLADEKHVASVYRKLRYAGFSSPSAIRVLREYSSRASDLEDAPDENASD